MAACVSFMMGLICLGSYTFFSIMAPPEIEFEPWSLQIWPAFTATGLLASFFHIRYKMKNPLLAWTAAAIILCAFCIYESFMNFYQQYQMLGWYRSNAYFIAFGFQGVPLIFLGQMISDLKDVMKIKSKCFEIPIKDIVYE